MNINIDKEQLKGFGKVGLKFGKAIVVEGVKAIALKTAAKAINVGFEDGFDGIKNIKLDDVIGGKKKGSGGLFTKKNKEVDEILNDLDKKEVTE